MYKCDNDELESYLMNKDKHIKSLKRLTYLEGDNQIDEFQEPVIY